MMVDISGSHDLGKKNIDRQRLTLGFEFPLRKQVTSDTNINVILIKITPYMKKRFILNHIFL